MINEKITDDYMNSPEYEKDMFVYIINTKAQDLQKFITIKTKGLFSQEDIKMLEEAKGMLEFSWEALRKK